MTRGRAALGRSWRLLVVLLLLEGLLHASSQGLPFPGKPGLAPKDYSRVRQWATDGKAWRASFAEAPYAACQPNAGLCAATPGSEDFGKLIVATSPTDYDARSDAGPFSPIGPVLDQRPCQTAVAFATISAAEAAAAAALQLNASSISLSQQDLHFCPDAQRSCNENLDVRAALSRFVNGTVVSYDCLPYTAAQTDDPAKLCNYRCRDVPLPMAGGKFRIVAVRSPYEGQRQIRRYGSFVTRFNLYQDFFDWIRSPAASDPNAVYDCPNSNQQPSDGHAVAVVGYNNTGGYWLVRSSWGTHNGDKGYFRVKFGVCGMLAPGDTAGVGFIPAKPLTLPVTGPVPDPTAPASSSGRSRLCYNYTARAGDYVSKIADAAVVRVAQLLLDNNSTLRNLDQPLVGTTLLLCDPDPSSVTATAAQGSAAAGQQNQTTSLNTTTAAAAMNSSVPASANVTVAAPAAVNVTASVNPPRPQPAVSTKAEEVAALLTFKDALGYASSDWKGDEPCLETSLWSGLYCNAEGRVYMIDLSSKGLTGSLSDKVDLSRIPHLQALWLFDNPTLSGTLPGSWSQQHKLKEISLYGCGLTGSLPASWGTLSRLRQLYLHNNRLTGSLPPEWGGLVNVTSLGLAVNELVGTIPASWSGMGNLKSISLYENAGLSGCIPPEWSSRAGGQPVQLMKVDDSAQPLTATKLCEACDTCRADGATSLNSSSSASSSSAAATPVATPAATPQAASAQLRKEINRAAAAPVLLTPKPSGAVSPGNAGAADSSAPPPPPAAAAGAGPVSSTPGATAVPGAATATGGAAAAATVFPQPAATVQPPPPPAATAAATVFPQPAAGATPQASTAPLPAVAGTAAAAAAAVPAPAPKPAATPQAGAGAITTAPPAPTAAAAAGTVPAPGPLAAPPSITPVLGAVAGPPAATAPPPPSTNAGPPPAPAGVGAAAITGLTPPGTATPPVAGTGTGAGPAAGAAAPPLPLPPAPRPALPPAPIQSVSVPVDPSLTVIPDRRRPNFMDVQASGRRRLLFAGSKRRVLIAI